MGGGGGGGIASKLSKAGMGGEGRVGGGGGGLNREDMHGGSTQGLADLGGRKKDSIAQLW